MFNIVTLTLNKYVIASNVYRKNLFQLAFYFVLPEKNKLKFTRTNALPHVSFFFNFCIISEIIHFLIITKNVNTFGSVKSYLIEQQQWTESVTQRCSVKKVF